MQPGLQLRVSQHLALTPQLQQSIRLLQLSTLELAQEVEQMLGDNPFLEREEDEQDGGAGTGDAPTALARAETVEQAGAAEEAEPAAADAAQWGADDAPEDSGTGFEERDWGGGGAGAGLEEDDVQERWHEGETLAEHLRQQALALRLTPPERAALAALIDSLDDNGYLDGTPEEIAAALAPGADADTLEALHTQLQLALRLLQSFDPAGVGARGLAECLQLQLTALAQERGADPRRVALIAVAQAIVRQPLEWLARRDWRRLAQACGAGEEDTRAAMALVARLEPRPGRRFAPVERNVIAPDVIVRHTPQGLRVQLNPAVLPRLAVHEAYASALRGHRGSEGHQALQQRLQEARWFIRNIQQRFDSILRVSQAIVRRQHKFFEHGPLAMRPLVMREIADELGLHESTISRVTSGKYMDTPQGTFELKYFFGSSLGTEAGGSASSIAVRALIRQLIAGENPAKPFSDGAIADLLKEQGIDCARRTVAKYREALRIAPASLRKAL